jgi:hypothetical protein
MITYNAFVFKQNDNAPISLSFIAGSAEIDQWSKVPTKLSNRVHHFQRSADPKHIEEIKKFFESDSSKSNSSPTAILLGVEPSKQDKIKIVDTDDRPIDLQSISTKPMYCKVLIDYTAWDSSEFEDTDHEIDALFEKVKDIYADHGEITENVDQHTEKTEDDNDGLEDDLVDLQSQEETFDNDDNDGIQDDDDDINSDSVGNGSQVEDSVTVSNELDLDHFFATLNNSALLYICRSKLYKEWSPNKKERLVEIFKDDLKPCLIIDGQHRIKGTRSIAGKPFLVSMLPNATWGELAFQFIVNNTSAKPVDQNILFGIVGESLTLEDLQQTEIRLNMSGIKVSLIKAAMRVQKEANPFRKMLKTNTMGEPGFLDATATKAKVIELWYGSKGKTNKSSFKKFATTPKKRSYGMKELFGQNCEGSNDAERTQYWQKDLWFSYFTKFWEAISDHFKGRLWPETQNDWPPAKVGTSTTPVQKEKLKLMGAVKLSLLQRAVLQRWADYHRSRLEMDGQTFADYKFTPEEFKTSISRIVQKIPPDFFLTLEYGGYDASKQLKLEMLEHMLDILEGNKQMADLKEERFWKK